MKTEITIKNYRCFSQNKPAKFEIRDGFTSVLGVNNSGKSTLLKFFCEFRELFGQFNLVGDQNQIALAIAGNVVPFTLQSFTSDINELFYNQNNGDIEIGIKIPPDETYKNLTHPKNITLIVTRASNTWRLKIDLGDGDKYIAASQVQIQSNGTFSRAILLVSSNLTADLTHYYNVFKILTDTLYIGAFRNAINIGSKDSYFDLSIGQSFIRQWRQLKSGPNRPNNESIIELTKIIADIFSIDQLEINSADEDSSIQIIINGKSYRLSDMGAGIAQFILVLANASVRKPSFILIDEPETNLHPSMQIKFLFALGSYAKIGTIISTHSYGLARSISDYIYTIRKNSNSESELVVFDKTPRFSEILGELSFSGYTELGFDKILLVEGVTDVKAIQQFLRLLKKDNKIVILPLGGGNLIKSGVEDELREIKRICDSVFALIDSEKSSELSQANSKHLAFKEVCDNIGINCYMLHRRSTENYLSDIAIKSVKGPNFKALGHFEQLNDLKNGWSKCDNWKIAREMTKEELLETDLGKFLNSI